jgi:TonB-dependent SusC/RagA subfamily outer membrane receptor
MISLASRALLSVGLVVGIVSGCARAGGKSQGDIADTTQSTPPPSSTVTAEDIRRTPNEPIEKALMGRFSGVEVTRSPDGGISVRIRGTTSILGSNEPLYVLDGIPIQPGPNGSLSGVNPHDIESIEVLKDAASTSIYGLRGANGVIVIKTKRPD